LRLSKALSVLSVTLSLLTIALRALGVEGIPAYAAVASFVAASTSFSLGAQILSLVSLAAALAPFGSNAILVVMIACSLALIGAIFRLVVRDAATHASRGSFVGSVALIAGMPLISALPLASRRLSVAEPLAVVLIAATASYALGISYALGRGLHVDITPISLSWLRGLSKRLFTRFSELLTWVILTTLISRALTLTGVPLMPSIIVAALTSLLTSLVARKHRIGRAALFTACAITSVILLKRDDVVSLGNALRLIEEVVRYLGW